MSNVINVGYSESYDSGNDPIIVRNDLNSKVIGVMLDVSSWTDSVIPAGTVVVKTTSTGVHKPLTVTDGAYGTLDSTDEYVGLTKATVLKEKPFVGVINMGEINEQALPYPLTTEMKTALKTAIPALYFD